MQAGDFILYDDQERDVNYPIASPFSRPSFQQHRGQLADTSPLFEEAQFYAPNDPTQSQSSSENVSRVSPVTLENVSPDATPPKQPSSGTLGTPLDLLSLHGSTDAYQRTTPKMAPLFPRLPQENQASPTASMSQQPPQNNDMNAATASLLFKSPENDTHSNMQLWRSYWSTHGGNAPVPSMIMYPDMLRSTNEAMGLQRAQPNDKLTVSPRDLHLDYNEATTPPAKLKEPPALVDTAPLFPAAPTTEDSLWKAPYGVSSGIETGSSTEEEDDEDEKPLVNGASLGTTVPNEQLLQQWSQAMFGSVPTDETMQTQPFRDSESVWPSVGPVFSTVSTSSESEDDSERVHKTPQTSRFSSYTPHQAMYRDGSGAMGAYGFMPASSQGSAMSTNMSTDSESRRSSAVSMSISESEAGGQDATGNRSPSIRRTAQVVDPTTDAQPSSLSPAQPAIRPRRSSSRNRRQEEMEASPATMGPPSSESSSQDGEGDGDSDYEQTYHVAQPVSRSVPRRGRPPRTISGHNKTHGSGSHHSLSTSPTSHGLPRRNASPPASGSVIRCEYVSPVTRQMCGTVFHRMYDLARHRITLHVREEAQLVKEGVLKVDQCVVLGKEVDVEKALSDLEWTCRICGASFSRKDAMLRHERLRHHA